MWILWAKFSHNIPKPYLCIECGQSYAYKGALKKHNVIHLKEKLFSCPICDKLFLEEKRLTEHSKIHPKFKYSCIKCDYVCKSKNSLTSHIMAHSSKSGFHTSKLGILKYLNIFIFQFKLYFIYPSFNQFNPLLSVWNICVE